MTFAKINAAIKHLGIELVGSRGAGYYYFLNLHTRDQVGESVMVARLSQLTLYQWVKEAEYASRINKRGKRIC
jgi:hypothetical protein